MDTVLWWWEELKCSAVDKIIIERLNKGEQITLTYGKLVERLLIIKSHRAINLYNRVLEIAENKLKDYKIHLDQPIVVLGDASASMEIAIKTSSIIMSILCAVCNAEMRLFRTIDEYIVSPPKNVADVVELSTRCHAHSSTCPAASLYPYFTERKVVKTFIVVTDEEENTNYGHYSFASLFNEYRKTVYPAKLIFVSFVKDKSYMIDALIKENPDIEKDILQFKLFANKPDLTKLDTILGSIAIQSQKFEERVIQLAEKLKMA
jgi:hypothetical protein